MVKKENLDKELILDNTVKLMSDQFIGLKMGNEMLLRFTVNLRGIIGYMTDTTYINSKLDEKKKCTF